MWLELHRILFKRIQQVAEREFILTGVVVNEEAGGAAIEVQLNETRV